MFDWLAVISGAGFAPAKPPTHKARGVEFHLNSVFVCSFLFSLCESSIHPTCPASTFSNDTCIRTQQLNEIMLGATAITPVHSYMFRMTVPEAIRTFARLS